MFSIVVALNPRADHDATNASTHAAWNASAVNALAGDRSRRPQPPATLASTPHTFFPPHNRRWHLTIAAPTLKIADPRR